MSLDHFLIGGMRDNAVGMFCKECRATVSYFPDEVTLPDLVIAADKHRCVDADKLERLERARREYERLQAELGIAEPSRLEPYSPRTHEILVSPSSQPASVTVDGEEKHYAFKHPGPQHPCFCNRVFNTARELAAHKRSCAIAHRVVNLDGHADEGGFKWGEQ